MLLHKLNVDVQRLWTTEQSSLESAEAADMKTVLAGPAGNHRGLRLMSVTSARADDMTIVFFFSLPPSWRQPESHVLQLPAVWFLVAEDVIRARTNWPPFLCCSLSSLFLLLLFFPPPVFPVFFFLFPHLRPCFTLTGYTYSVSQSSAQGPGTWWNKNKIKNKIK